MDSTDSETEENCGVAPDGSLVVTYGNDVGREDFMMTMRKTGEVLVHVLGRAQVPGDQLSPEYVPKYSHYYVEYSQRAAREWFIQFRDLLTNRQRIACVSLSNIENIHNVINNGIPRMGFEPVEGCLWYRVYREDHYVVVLCSNEGEVSVQKFAFNPLGAVAKGSTPPWFRPIKDRFRDSNRYGTPEDVKEYSDSAVRMWRTMTGHREVTSGQRKLLNEWSF